MSEILATHLLLSLYVCNAILVIFGVVCIISLWSSKDFSNAMIVVIFILGIAFTNIIWRLVGLPEIGF